MKFILETHNIRLTKAIEDHVLTRIDKLEHFDRWAIDARVTLEHDHTRAPAKAFKCSMRLGVRGNDLYATDSENDLYAAIDLVTKKIEQQIRKRHSKRKEIRHSQAAKSKRARQEKSA
jgi:putative sigma-54 modulation protein